MTTRMNVDPPRPCRRRAARVRSRRSACPVELRAAAWRPAALAWERGGRLVALWASDERDRGARVSRCASRCVDADGLTRARTARCRTPTRAIPDLAADLSRRRTACSAPPSTWSASRPRRDDQRPWLRHGDWPIDRFPLRRDFEALAEVASPGRRTTPFVRVDGDGVHEIPVGPGARRHHRARALPLLSRRREGAAPRGAPGLRAQGHREALRGAGARRRRTASRAASRGDTTVAYAWAYAHGRWRRVGGTTPPPRALWLRALLLERERVANHLGDLGYLGNDGGVRLRPGAVLAAQGGLAARRSARRSATGC